MVKACASSSGGDAVNITKTDYRRSTVTEIIAPQ